MFKGELLVLIFLMSFKNFKLDMMLNGFRNKLWNWSKNMPKVWHGYIRMCFYRNFENKTKMESINNIIFQMLLKSRLLLLANDQRVGKTWNWRCHHFTVNKECPVKKPIGLFLLKSQFIYMYSLPQYNNESLLVTENHRNVRYEKETYSYAYWNLNARYRLNITFFTVYFLNIQLYYCLKDCLCINSSTHIYHTFCMQYSSFSYYSDTNKVTLKVRIDNCHDNEYYIKGMFMIIDKDQLVSTSAKNDTTPELVYYKDQLVSASMIKDIKPELVYNIGDKDMWRYFISVRKIHQIILKSKESNNNTYVVFDGPGLLSDTMDITSKIITSTFQCLVVLLTLRGREIFNEDLTFTSKTISINNQIIISSNMNEMIYFPNTMCNKSLCTLRIDASEGYHVNITAAVINSTVPHNFHCSQAGLLAVERLATEYKESKTICESSKWKSINFYSLTSSFNLIMYWYKEYGEISASLIISQTKCKPVFINVCLLNLLAVNSKAHFQTYLKEVTKFSDINFNLQTSSFYSFLYGVKMTHCVVFQFSSTYEDLRDEVEVDWSSLVISDVNAFQHNIPW